LQKVGKNFQNPTKVGRKKFLREDIVCRGESVYVARADIRYRAVDDCSGWGIWCNQSVNVATENNPK
jgi:hypothetical protein